MAKNKKSRKRSSPARETAASAVTVAGEAPDEDRYEASIGNDESASIGDGGQGGDHGGKGRGGGPSGWSAGDRGARRGPAAPASSAGLFSIYKVGQGYYTRLATAMGSALVLVFGAHYVYLQLGAFSPAVQLGVPSIFLAVTGAILFWITGSNRKSNDFFIATEGEMKKVSWSTRREVIGSTKVVLAFTLIMAVFLFVVDILFLLLFSSVDVLQMDIKTILGLGS